MDDDLDPIATPPAAARRGQMMLTLLPGNRQMRLSASAYRWLREAHGLDDPEVPLRIVLDKLKGAERIAVVREQDGDSGGVQVDPGNFYAAGTALRVLLGNPAERVDIPLEANVERRRLEGAIVVPQAGGVPAGPHAGSERPNADASGPPAPPAPSPLAPEDAAAADETVAEEETGVDAAIDGNQPDEAEEVDPEWLAALAGGGDDQPA